MTGCRLLDCVIEGRRCFAVDDGVAAALADRGGVAARPAGFPLEGKGSVGAFMVEIGGQG